MLNEIMKENDFNDVLTFTYRNIVTKANEDNAPCTESIQHDPLLPCPFCGGRAEIRTYTTYGAFAAQVHCTNCHVSGMGIALPPLRTNSSGLEPIPSETNYDIHNVINELCLTWNKRGGQEAGTSHYHMNIKGLGVVDMQRPEIIPASLGNSIACVLFELVEIDPTIIYKANRMIREDIALYNEDMDYVFNGISIIIHVNKWRYRSDTDTAMPTAEFGVLAAYTCDNGDINSVGIDFDISKADMINLTKSALRCITGRYILDADYINSRL